MLLYVIFSLLGSVVAQFTNNENTTTSTTTVHKEIVYVNPLSERTKIIICISVLACVLSIPMIILFKCLNKLAVNEERALLPHYYDQEYSINTINVGFEGQQPLPPPPSYMVDSEM